MVHITTILHAWIPVDQKHVVAGPTAGEDHLCTECAQTSLASDPHLRPRTDPLPAVRTRPVMSKALQRLLDQVDRYQRARFPYGRR